MGDPIVLKKQDILAALYMALLYVLAHANTDGRAGGYFALYERGPTGQVGRALILETIGTVIFKCISLYCRLVREKVHRLSQHLEHLSSWQSRDPDNNKWGGAIVAGIYYLSFSGLPELCDEAIVLITARTLGIISAHEAMRIAQISNNELYNQWALSAQAMR